MLKSTEEVFRSVSIDLKDLDLKDERRVWFYSPGRKALRAIALVPCNGKLGDLSLGHRQTALVPSSNDLAQSHLECKRLLSRILGAPELGACFLLTAGAVHGDLVALLDVSARARAQHLLLHSLAHRPTRHPTYLTRASKQLRIRQNKTAHLQNKLNHKINFK